MQLIIIIVIVVIVSVIVIIIVIVGQGSTPCHRCFAGVDLNTSFCHL